ncbi:D-alanyl-D-alanine carboxypeptidase [Sphingobacterium paludis]|uniref:D-alanyl-D-alanine carboxypeptidase/D-alanyl-D-alanine-endopeptidase (Penicillin-binding protein 4) n=1 Tax=Sphingobacterium paludis TaxID=1476465 RepID=A0A4R7DCP4_9SPHI|nr:D-alanyl-D-alanine carboxypeptidase [Sphingobacterium paludis]TDS17704.1 D-alanyl-D-alanine carboxypeptidase/D-alanyl-D-alanine-endopeptidase (penicillin-binding protein 4) [Sphingobacterium paludis]
MKNTLLAITMLFATFKLFGQTFDVNPIKRELEQSPILRNHFFGVCLYDLDSNRFVMGVNENKHFTPASNAKVFTLFAALKYLGDSIAGLHYVERGDSLIFWGTGDPTFLHHRHDSGKVFNFLKKSDKKLFYAMDDSAEETFYRKGWAVEDYEEYYQPEISSFPIYGNVVTFREQGGRLSSSPSYFQAAVSQQADGKTDYTLRRKFDTNLFVQNRSHPPHKYVNEKPFRYSTELFIKLLTDTLKREVSLIKAPRPVEVQTIYSTATASLLREMMLPSDNFLAEQLQMMAALKRYHGFRTAQLRQDMGKEFYDFFRDKVDLYDASGLSSYNKVTPRSMVEVLLMVVSILPDTTALHQLFPAGGVDGTLKRTYKLDAGEPFVWAKTGTISAVHNQSGFIRTRSGRNLVFSFLNTNFLGGSSSVSREIARVVTFIRQHY